MLFLQQALELVVREFQDNADAASQPAGTGKSIQWNGVRYMLTEVTCRGNISQRVYEFVFCWLGMCNKRIET